MVRPGETLEVALLRRSTIDRGALDLARAASLSAPFVDVKHFRRDPKAVATIEASWAQTHDVLPLCFDGPVLVIACAVPIDVELEQILAFTLNRIVELVMARPDELQRAIVEAYGPSEDAATAMTRLIAIGIKPSMARLRPRPARSTSGLGWSPAVL